jgi:hypothetical protein
MFPSFLSTRIFRRVLSAAGARESEGGAETVLVGHPEENRIGKGSHGLFFEDGPTCDRTARKAAGPCNGNNGGFAGRG